MPPSLTGERLTGIAFAMVTAREHPLASLRGTIPKSELTKHVQLVLTDRPMLSARIRRDVVQDVAIG